MNIYNSIKPTGKQIIHEITCSNCTAGELTIASSVYNKCFIACVSLKKQASSRHGMEEQ